MTVEHSVDRATRAPRQHEKSLLIPKRNVLFYGFDDFVEVSLPLGSRLLWLL